MAGDPWKPQGSGFRRPERARSLGVSSRGGSEGLPRVAVRPLWTQGPREWTRAFISVPGTRAAAGENGTGPRSRVP